jgi:hypothetical protein
MARWAHALQTEKDAHETTKRELELANKSHRILRDYIEGRALWDDFVLWVQERG